ncbi:MAG: hypothetical protein AABW64_02360 [Nanoarchaeota archaeon]
MNWRMRRIFGSQFSSFSIPLKKTHYIIIAVILMIGVLGWSLVRDGNTESSASLIPKADITGAAVAQQAGQQPSSQTTAQTQQQTDNSTNSSSGNREFYEYKEECARDMKQYTDDLEDVTTQVDAYTLAAEALKKEYDKKVAELQEQYQVPLDNENAKKEKAERTLENVMQKWGERKAYCDQKYPA